MWFVTIIQSFFFFNTKIHIFLYDCSFYLIIQLFLPINKQAIPPLSTRTLFLISGPEVLYAGVPTPLAVTVLANFSGSVMAEVAHGNTTVAQTVDFQGGDNPITLRFGFDLHKCLLTF